MGSPTVVSDVVRPSAGELVPAGGADAPVRVEVAMPRALFDLLTDHDDAPRCRYDEHTGLAEFVAVPDMTHEVQTMAAGQLVLPRPGRHSPTAVWMSRGGRPGRRAS